MEPKELLKREISQQQAIITKAKEEKRDLSEEEKKQFDDLQERIDLLKKLDENPQEQLKDGVQEERERSLEIAGLCKHFGLEAEKYIKSGASVENVRAEIVENMMKNSAPISQRGSGNVEIVKDEQDKFRAAASDGLMMRSGLTVDKAADGARNFRNFSLKSLAVECFARDGEDYRELMKMSAEEIYEKACRSYMNPTAAFPAILDNTINKSIVQMYNEVPTTFQDWTTKGSLSDFKETKDHEYVIGGTGDFAEVAENGELRADRPSTDVLPTRSLKEHGLTFSMTRKAFINDDIGFVASVPGLYAQRAKKTIDKQVYSVLFNNVNFADGIALFHKNHGNLLTSGSAPSLKVVQSMILAMQGQKDQFGEAIYMVPKTIIVPIGYGMDLDVILHSSYVPGSPNNDINPLAKKNLEVIETPVLNALAGTGAIPWFMVADKTSAKGIQVDYLNGQETPTVRRMEAPGVLGFTWDIYLDWGIAIRDYRGMIKNPGVAMTSPI